MTCTSINSTYLFPTTYYLDVPSSLKDPSGNVSETLYVLFVCKFPCLVNLLSWYFVEECLSDGLFSVNAFCPVSFWCSGGLEFLADLFFIWEVLCLWSIWFDLGTHRLTFHCVISSPLMNLVFFVGIVGLSCFSMVLLLLAISHFGFCEGCDLC